MPVKLPPPTKLGVDLDTWAARVDRHLSTETGIAQAIREYRTASDRKIATDSKSDARTLLNAKMDRMILSGAAVINGHRIVAERRGGAARQVLLTGDVAKAHPKLWEASRPAAPVLGIKYPTPLAGWEPMPTNMPVDLMREIDRIKSAATEAGSKAAAARELINGVFTALTGMWSGEPLVTTDVWRLGWSSQRRFNETLCRALAAQQGIDLTPIETLKITAPHTVYTVLENDPHRVDYCPD